MTIIKKYEEKNTIWFVVMEDSFLYKADLTSGYIEEVLPLLEESDKKFAFSDILGYENYFIFVPCDCDHILILDRRTWIKERIQIPQTDWKIGETCFNFFTGFINKDHLYLFGFSFPGILKVNLKTKEIDTIDNWVDRKRFMKLKQDGCFHVNYTKKDHTIYFPFENQDALLVFNLENEHAEIQRVGNRKRGYIAIERDGDDIWLIPRDIEANDIVKWNLKDKSKQYFHSYPESFEKVSYAFYQTVKTDNKILLFAHGGKTNIWINLKTGEMETFEEIYPMPENGPKHPLVERQGREIFVALQDRFIWWDFSSGIKREVRYIWSDKIQDRKENMRVKALFERIEEKTVGENKGDYTIENFIRYIAMR